MRYRTNKTAVKRFKITSNGKIMRRNARKGHLMMKKSGSRRRRLSLESTVRKGEELKIFRMLGTR